MSTMTQGTIWHILVRLTIWIQDSFLGPLGKLFRDDLYLLLSMSIFGCGRLTHLDQLSTHKHLETLDAHLLSNVATDALVLEHHAISIHSIHQIFYWTGFVQK